MNLASGFNVDPIFLQLSDLFLRQEEDRCCYDEREKWMDEMVELEEKGKQLACITGVMH